MIEVQRDLRTGVEIRGKYEICAIEPTGASIAIDEATRALTGEPRYDAALQSLKVGATHPTIATEFYNPLASDPALRAIAGRVVELRQRRGDYTYIDQEHIPHHQHVGRHVVAVAAAVSATSEALGLTELARVLATRLAIVHDGGKIADVLVNQRIGELGLSPRDFGLLSDNPMKEFLERSGASTAQAELLTQASRYTGHSSLVNFLAYDGRALTLSPEVSSALKLVHLADDMLSETTVLTTNERMEKSNFRQKYQYLWEKGLAAEHSEGEWRFREVSTATAASRPHFLGCYADLQVATSNAICAELVRSQGLSRAEPPEVQVKMLVTEQLRKLGWAQ